MEPVLEPILGKISGFADYTEEQNFLISLWQEKIADTFKLHGFTKLNAIPVEYIDNLQLKGGIAKQIYRIARLQDGALTDLGLPFDRTVPLALYMVRHLSEISLPFKRYDVAYSFRGEHAQAGRFRGFIQADVDIVDKDHNLLDDTMCLLTIIKALENLKIPAFVMLLNHLKISHAVLHYFKISKDKYDEFLKYIDKMSKLSDEEIFLEGKKILNEKTDDELLFIIKTLKFRGKIHDFPLLDKLDANGKKGMEELITVIEQLKICGVDEKILLFAPAMVRGLDYYTGMMFETILLEYEKYGSIAGGGRYDGLIATFLQKEKNLGGVGGSIGISRLFDILLREKLLPKTELTSTQVMIIPREANLIALALDVAEKLRDFGYNTDLYIKKNITKGLEFCNRKKIPFVLMLMEQNKFVIKDMHTTKQMETGSLEDVQAFMKK